MMIVFLYIYPPRTGGEHARKHTSGPPCSFEYKSLGFFCFLSMHEFTTVPISSNSAHYSKAKSQVWKERISRATQQQRAIPSSEDSTKNEIIVKRLLEWWWGGGGVAILPAFSIRGLHKHSVMKLIAQPYVQVMQKRRWDNGENMCW